MTEKKHLYIIWTNADVETAEKMVFMYGINALLKGWWEESTIVIWGPTAKLAATNEVVKELIHKANDAGVIMAACRACSDMYGVTADLESQNIEVIHWGERLTKLLKNDEKILTI
ncbi:hypothetical protein [Maridesulfovibrio zosterae]|uniref:hypothetical protein n=1 Tax=Maridesulfovibrio zosterae TaxID=82171 RepID=UPI00042A2832|nr:hypothetical protein [Maridesulfovibrio zosterae]